MEFLVTLTALDAQGVEVDRDGTRGQLGRPWHAHGDQRVIGLFTAENRGLLDKVLAGLPRRIRVAEVAEFLARIGVETCFGIVSVHNIPMLDAIGPGRGSSAAS